MIYLLHGTESILIENEITNIMSKHKIDELSISKHSLNLGLEPIIEDIMTVSFFSDSKLIIVRDAYPFTTAKGPEINLKRLEDLISKKLEDVIVIFTTKEPKLDGRKKITKLINKEGKVLTFNEIKNINEYITNLFDGYTIDINVINKLIARVGKDSLRLLNEAEKLKIYKIDDKTITEEDVMSLTREKINIDVFELIDNIIKKNKETALKSYAEMIKLKEEPIKLIVMIANQIRLMHTVKIMNSMGFSEGEMASKLKVHPYRVKLSYIKSLDYQEEELRELLVKLAELDYGIKSGSINKYTALDWFIVTI